MRLSFSGLVTTGDAYRVDSEETPGSVHVGGKDVVETIHDARPQFKGPVTVAVLDDRYEGDLYTDLGWGYSDWTPMDPDSLKVGDHDLVEILERHEGKQVRLVIADEPIDLGDEDE